MVQFFQSTNHISEPHFHPKTLFLSADGTGPGLNSGYILEEMIGAPWSRTATWHDMAVWPPWDRSPGQSSLLVPGGDADITLKAVHDRFGFSAGLVFIKTHCRSGFKVKPTYNCWMCFLLQLGLVVFFLKRGFCQFQNTGNNEHFRDDPAFSWTLKSNMQKFCFGNLQLPGGGSCATSHVSSSSFHWKKNTSKSKQPIIPQNTCHMVSSAFFSCCFFFPYVPSPLSSQKTFK